jgi:hypothetical protein
VVGSISSHALTVLVAACYLALGVFDPSQAQGLWWPFGIAVLLLSCLNMWLERGRR